MSQTQPRYAFVCPKLETLSIEQQGESFHLESDCYEQLSQYAAHAIDSAMKQNIRVLLLDRESGKQLDFYNFLMA
ncbi:hypothetical protein L4C54_09605 [Vibrio lamellibrachiae]|uniref:hypothetical protein n=1 Tax=Vibrio lamellibrachiae TaxID=2910253 RepID=UPI003D0AF7BB